MERWMDSSHAQSYIYLYLYFAQEMPLPGQFEVLYDKSPLAEICHEVIPTLTLTLTLTLSLSLTPTLTLTRCSNSAAPCRGASLSRAARHRSTGHTNSGGWPAPRCRAWPREDWPRAPRRAMAGGLGAATTFLHHQESRCSI
jgi:hypothetical protein